MAMPKTDPWYRDRVYRMLADGKKSADVVREVERQAMAAGRKDLPGERTIRRIIAEYKALPVGEQAAFGPVVWPDSFEAGVLPWEAAADVLELVAEHFHVTRLRLTVDEALWWYRLRLAVPGVPVRAGRIALTLAFMRRWPEARDKIYRLAGIEPPEGVSHVPRWELTGFLALGLGAKPEYGSLWKQWREATGEPDPEAVMDQHLDEVVKPETAALKAALRDRLGANSPLMDGDERDGQLEVGDAEARE